MTEISWLRRTYRFLTGHEDAVEPQEPLRREERARRVTETLEAVGEQHNQGIGRAYVEGMLACRQEKDSTNPYYLRSEQGRAYDSGYRDEGKS